VAAAGKTIFFSSHILSEVEAIADHVAVLHNGTIALCDELDNLRNMQKMLRLVYTERPPAEEMAVLRNLPGVRQLEQEGRAVRLRIEGDVDALTPTIQARPYALRDREVVAVPLEDLLLEYLRGDGA
jgi:ABC-2 type transport system ATP-binding protein